MANPFKAIWGFLKKLFARPGMQQFLETYINDAEELIKELAQINNNTGFHGWYNEAFAKASQRYNEVRGTWIAILINLAYESYKAKLENDV